MVLATTSGRVFQSTDGGQSLERGRQASAQQHHVDHLQSVQTHGGVARLICRALDPRKRRNLQEHRCSFHELAERDAGRRQYVLDSRVHGESSVYINRRYSTDGGLSWQPFGPLTAGNEIQLHPGELSDRLHPGQYLRSAEDHRWRQTWQVKNQGLAAMSCNSMVGLPDQSACKSSGRLAAGLDLPQ